MAAITRWVQYDPASNGTAGDGAAGCIGTKGTSIGTASVGDSFTVGGTTNRLYVSIDGISGPYITLYSGASLDPRFLATDITNKMRAAGKSDASWDNAICKWENTPNQGNRFKIYSGSLGTGSTVLVTSSGVNSVGTTLGFDTKSENGGTVGTNTFNGTVNIGGVYKGFLPETYKVVVTRDGHGNARGIGTPTKSITYDGVMTTGGVYNHNSDTTYVITIDVTNGSTQGAGTTNVPTLSWVTNESIVGADISDASSVSTELLYPNTWYNVGTKGLMVKFTDAVFAAGTWSIPCYQADYAEASNVTAAPGVAYVAYSSDRGDMGNLIQTTASGTPFDLGTRGLTMEFTGYSNDLSIRDEFFITCHGPEPLSYNISSVSFGNVTVSTESDVKCVSFEVESGAYQLSSFKFGLQSHGSFSHHDAGNSDTLMRFGTTGPGNPSGTGLQNGIEWYTNITPSDIDSDVSPAYLYSTKADLAVVATADDSESVGNAPYILTSDPVWFGVKLGSSETGSSSMNYRAFFDYS
jgi:hypothetical protein